MDSRPSLSMLQLHLLVMFLAGVIMSSWVWTSSTVDTWRRCVRRTLNSQAEEPVRLKKHKVIAQAFAKRKSFNNAGRLSISFHSTYEDPVGMNFDMNSAASQDLSSTWAAALPKLMTRRGALIGVTTGSNSSQQHNSVDSEISYSVRRVSVESRRHSLDSQVSVQIAEVTATRKAAATPMPRASATVSGGRGRKARNRRQRREFGCSRNSRVGPLFVRKGSTTSQESQLGTQILSALTLANTNIPSFVPNLRKRRAGNAGLDSSKVNLPFTLPGQSLDLSDEDQNHDDKMPGPAKKFDVILCGEVNEVGLEYANQSEGEGSGGSGAENEERVGMSNDLHQDGINSRGDDASTKRNSRSIGKNDSVEICHIKDSKNAGECYWKPNSELNCHQSRSGDNYAHRIRTAETNRCKNDCGDLRNRNIPDEVKLYLTEESDDEPLQKLNFMPSVDVAGVSDGSTSFCPELSRLAVLSSHSGISVGSPHNFVTGKIRMIKVAPCNQNNSGDKSGSACEVGTQTSLSIDCIEMQETNAAHSSPPQPPLQTHTSQSTQVSPLPSPSSVPPPKPQRLIQKSQSPPISKVAGNVSSGSKIIEKSQSPYINKMTGNVSSDSRSRGLNYSYNAQQLMKELAVSNLMGAPVRPERRKSVQGKDIARSKSADDKSIELQCKPVHL